MTQPPDVSPAGRLARRASLILAFLLGLALFPVAATSTATPSTTATHAAGLVIGHGNGTMLYYYVEFTQPAISAIDLLQRAGVSIDVAPFSGIGQAVCRIDGEGCPSTNCFCKSYANPSVYWRYERLSETGSWISLPYGADQKSIHDGDVVGFSWSSRDGELPAVTLDQIARMNGITRLTVALAPDRVATASSSTAAATTPSPSSTSSTTPSQAAVSGTPVAAGIKVDSSGTKTPVDATTSSSGGGNASYAWFGAGLVLILVVGAIAVMRQRRAGR